MALPEICTIGYEGATVEGLIGALKQAGVTRVLDVREAPFSKREEFSKEALAAALAEYGISYTHMRELGNPPEGREAARAGHMIAFREILNAHLDSEVGQAGLTRALALAAEEKVCLLCLERSAQHCHRSVVSARMHQATGQTIVNLTVSRTTAHPAQAAFDF
ncbi:MAG: DUF488 domain-containing protein [Alphaproteobacteria bacterium]